MPRATLHVNGRRLARLRGEAALTQRDLAEQAGFGLRTISKIESGKPTTPFTLSTLLTVLTRRLGRPVTIHELIDRKYPENDVPPVSPSNGRLEVACYYASAGHEPQGRPVTPP